MTTIEQRDSAIFPYTVHGEGTKAIIFIHGFLDAGHVWGNVIDSLGELEKKQLVTLDLPGMGELRSDKGPFTLKRMAELVCTVVDSLAVPTVLVGQSMGAQVAELAAVARKDLVRGLVLITPIPLAGLPVPEEMAQVLRSIGGNEIGQREMRTQFSRGLDEAAIENLVTTGMQINPLVARELFDAWSGGDPSGTERSPIQGKVLVMGGGIDPLSSPQVIEKLVVPHFHDGYSVIFPEACHWLHMEQPKKAATNLKNYLSLIQF